MGRGVGERLKEILALQYLVVILNSIVHRFKMSAIGLLSLGVINCQANLQHELDRIFPLHDEAISWKGVNFEKYSKIVVSGPQRSGTTYFSAALAKYLAYDHWDEMRSQKVQLDSNKTIHVRGNTNMTDILLIPRKMVLQRPAMSHVLHTYPAHPDLLVIFMARNCLDVFRSQNRILSDNGRNGNVGWTCKYGRKIEWIHYNSNPVLRQHADSMHDMICTIKQQVYKRYQRKLMKKNGISTFSISYNSLKTFSFFKNASDRKHYRPKEVHLD